MTGLTGQDFARMRLAAGVSLRAVATRFQIPPATLRLWETSAAPLSETRQRTWAAALIAARRAHDSARLEELHARGFTVADLAVGHALWRQLPGVEPPANAPTRSFTVRGTVTKAVTKLASGSGEGRR